MSQSSTPWSLRERNEESSVGKVEVAARLVDECASPDTAVSPMDAPAATSDVSAQRSSTSKKRPRSKDRGEATTETEPCRYKTSEEFDTPIKSDVCERATEINTPTLSECDSPITLYAKRQVTDCINDEAVTETDVDGQSKVHTELGTKQRKKKMGEIIPSDSKSAKNKARLAAGESNVGAGAVGSRKNGSETDSETESENDMMLIDLLRRPSALQPSKIPARKGGKKAAPIKRAVKQTSKVDPIVLDGGDSSSDDSDLFLVEMRSKRRKDSRAKQVAVVDGSTDAKAKGKAVSGVIDLTES
jgi:hypothetical protein